MDKLAHRKAKKMIRVVDQQGNPVAGKPVNFKLVNHEFLFGCGAFESLPYANGFFKDDADTGAVSSPKRASPRPRSTCVHLSSCARRT